MPAHAWDQTRGPETMARWLAVFFLGGSTIALASLAVPHWHNTNTAGTAITALCGYPAAAILFRLGPRLRPAMFHVLLATGSAIISLGVYFQRNSLGASARSRSRPASSGRSRSPSSTLTTSRSGTTPMATKPATRC